MNTISKINILPDIPFLHRGSNSFPIITILSINIVNDHNLRNFRLQVNNYLLYIVQEVFDKPQFGNLK
jgi:hypothetical protein